MMKKALYKSNGFTIAEMLVSLAVMAILLTAMAVAFNASATNYKENAEIFNAINTGRQAMLRMTNQFRTAQRNSIPTSETNPTIQCSFVPVDSNQFSRFRFDNAGKAVYLDSGGNSYLLCDHVSAMNFNRWVVGTEVKGVQMSMTITVGNENRTISGAAVLRRAM